MARVKIVKPDNVDDPAVAGIFEWVTEMEGSVPNHFFVEMNFPEFFPAKLGATKVLWEAGELEMEEIQHVGILVSQANGCPYCTAAFCTCTSLPPPHNNHPHTRSSCQSKTHNKPRPLNLIR